MKLVFWIQATVGLRIQRWYKPYCRASAELQYSNPLITWLVLPVSGPYRQVWSKRHLINIKRKPLWFISLRKQQGFLGASAVHEEKDQLYICIFLIINHSTTVCLSSYFWLFFFFFLRFRRPKLSAEMSNKFLKNIQLVKAVTDI